MRKARAATTVVAPGGSPNAGIRTWGAPPGVRCGQVWEPPAWGTRRGARAISFPRRVLILAWLAVACAAQGTDRRQPQPSGGGAWTHWGGWSTCSSTCGDGAAFRTRRCIRFPEEQPCRGKPRQYRVCELDECPAGSVPFRAVQCALYNGKSVLGGQTPYQWVPFQGAPSLCDLNCLAVGHNFYYNFGRVLDGTRCSPESPDLCISGRCLRVACDGTLGSEAQADACGVCNGRNESCLFVQKVFRAALPTSGFFGYENVTRIPAGARHIKVTDRSRNYLALMNANQRYIINGAWAIDRPGPYEVAGTKVHYARTADVHESFEAAGPTQEDLTVMVLLQAPNPGIEYEFWLPRESPQPVRSDTSPLRQQQTREAEGDAAAGPHPFMGAVAAAPPQVENSAKEVGQQSPWEEPVPTLPEAPPQPGRCGKCNTPKGKSQRAQRYCSSDFGSSAVYLGAAGSCLPPASGGLQESLSDPVRVFRARILSKRVVGQETRYDLQVKQTYRNHFPLVHREYVWVPNACDCPPLAERREYVLMARRHVNFEHTLNRILLPQGGYARPWTPREDLQLRDLAGRCGEA